MSEFVEGLNYGVRLLLQWRLWAAVLTLFGGLIFMVQSMGGLDNVSGSMGFIGVIGGFVSATVANSFLSEAIDRASPE